MLPKLSVVGVTVRWDCVPMPVSGALMGSVESEVEIARVPVRVPVCVGVKVICSVQEVSAARVLFGVGQVPVAV